MPVVVEIILERVTNIAMGTEIDNITEFEEILDRRRHAAADSADWRVATETHSSKSQGEASCRSSPPI